jgi:hypothetical protein
LLFAACACAPMAASDPAHELPDEAPVSDAAENSRPPVAGMDREVCADQARSIPADLEIRLARTGGMGSGTRFTVVLHADGGVDYEGLFGVGVRGPAHDRVDAAQIRRILEALDFFTATNPERHPSDGPDCHVGIEDIADVRISVHRDGAAAYYTSEKICVTAAAWQAIYGLADCICEILETGRWTER